MRLGLAALTCSIGVVLAGCGNAIPPETPPTPYDDGGPQPFREEDETEATAQPSEPREPRQQKAAPKPTPTPTPQPAPQGPGGLSSTEVSAVHRIALQTGYSYQGVPPRQSALLAVTVCERVASGATSWEAEEREAIASGAPPSAASKWNDYVREYVC